MGTAGGGCGARVGEEERLLMLGGLKRETAGASNAFASSLTEDLTLLFEVSNGKDVMTGAVAELLLLLPDSGRRGLYEVSVDNGTVL